MDSNDKKSESIPFSTLFNEGPDAIIVTDQTGRIIQANSRTVEILGYQRDALCMLNISEIAKSTSECHLEEVVRQLDETRFVSCEAFCTRRDGIQFPADITITRITFDSHATLYFFISDATSRKEKEEKIKNSSRMRSLHMLAGSVAHDFNNMLTSIVGHIELAMTTISAKSRASEDLSTALKDAKRMAELSLRMLEYSGKGVIDRTIIDLNEALASVSDKLTPRVSSHVAMNLSGADTRVPVIGEKDMLETAFTNILLNALEAVERTGGTVNGTCSLETLGEDGIISSYINNQVQPGDYACLTVSDSGYGMDDIILGKIFDPFFSTKGSGRGLGLTETQGIILAHGGAISVSTVAGQGSTFKVYLPLFKETITSKQISMPKKSANQKRTVMIIDDDASVRRYANRILEKLGFATIMAENGEEGINEFRNHADEVDLAIIDMIMPRMNGDEVMRQMRKLRPGLKVMIISGYTETLFMEKFRDEQPSGFLYKPFVTSDFVDKITQILKAQ